MPTNNQTVHAFATVPAPAPALNVVRSDGCVLTHPATGQFVVTVPAGFGAQPENLKVTVNLTPPGAAPLVPVLQWVSQQVLQVLVFDTAAIPAPADPDSLWITVEIVPRVS